MVQRIGAVLIAGSVAAGCASGSTDQAAPLASVDPTTSAARTDCASPDAGTVWVANEGGDSLNVIDALEHRVVTTVTGVGAPHNVQADPDGARAWAVSGTGRILVGIDATTYRVIDTAPTGDHPAHVVVSADASRAYVTNSGDGTVMAYDTAPLRRTATTSVAPGVHGLRPLPDGEGVVVAGTEAGALHVLEGDASQRGEPIRVGAGPVQVAVAPDARFAYVSLNSEQAVAKVDLHSRTVVARTAVASAPVQVFLTGDGRRLLSADQGTAENPGRSISVIDTDTMRVERTIGTGAGPHGVVADPGGCRAWVTNLYDGTVSVLDLVAGRSIATVPVAEQPNGVSFAPRSPSPAPAEVHLDLPTSTGIPHDHEH